MMDERLPAMRSTMNYADTSATLASWLRGRIGRWEIERREALLMRDEMSVKSFRRQVVKCAIAAKAAWRRIKSADYVARTATTAAIDRG